MSDEISGDNRLALFLEANRDADPHVLLGRSPGRAASRPGDQPLRPSVQQPSFTLLVPGNLVPKGSDTPILQQFSHTQPHE
jgi:hypothetical protein